MRCRRAHTMGGLAGVLLLIAAGSVSAQSADTVVAVAERIARFDDARAVAVDPAGRLYVVDAGRDVVVRLSADGRVDATLGGPGAAEGQFDEPSDIDPTNGLVLIIADAGNGRLQRFSRDFLFLEALPVPAATELAAGRSAARTYRPEDAAVDDPAEGRPTAVVSTVLNDTFALDEIQGHVLMWDATRRLVDVIGGFGAGRGSLMQPVALAADEQALYVADAGQGAVNVYDLKGQYMTTFAAGRVPDIRNVEAGQGEVWLVLPDALRVYDQQGRYLRTVRLPVEEPLRDVALLDERLWVLTESGLYQVNVP